MSVEEAVALLSKIVARPSTSGDEKAVADILVAEPSELIGTGIAVGREYVDACIDLVKSVNPEIMVLPSAGISCGNDCYNIIMAGADGSGSSSGICKAEDPAAMAEEMMAAVRKAYDEREGKA